ncbi:cryptochrome/photolyase family protein [Pseudolysinimonas sp.]|uniref:cryptochrome/photolyase family protein n=1 Tax=Pseudolysinimonas sp. TaxID=2680009 RepID=UPI003F8160A6
MTRTRWLLADQLGPHFDDGGPIVLVEVVELFRRRPTHRQKAHLILSALRHRAAELGDRVEYRRAVTFAEALPDGELEVIGPTSWAARRLAHRVGAEILPSRGFVASEEEFAGWVAGRDTRSLVMDRFYRWQRERLGILMDGAQPEGGRWSLDADNRQPPPRGASGLGLPDPWMPVEDEIDAEVRRDLDALEADGVRFLGRDGPRRFAATRREALHQLRDFVDTRLADFGPYEDASLAGDDWMAHSRLSVALNRGLLHPMEVVERVLAASHDGAAPLASVEGVVRQLIGWRDWVWHLYWHLGEDYVARSNHLDARRRVSDPFWALDGAGVEAACLHHVLDQVGREGWTHHIQRLMILGNFALQQRYSPRELTEWFAGAFVDGTPWVMPANVTGMSQYADGGIVATKPYVAGGAYIDRMSDFCAGCPFDPKKRLGDDACPFTAGYWAFLDRNERRLAGNHRMAQPLAGLRRLADREQVVEQEAHRTRW